MLHLRTLLFLVMTLNALAALGCQGTTSDKDVVFIDVTEAQKLVRGSKGVLGMGQASGVYVDPRGASEYAKGHIPGALNIPFVDINQTHKQLNDYDVIVVYGNDYGDDIGKIMAKRLVVLKHDDVKVLHGGLRAWEQAGNPIDPPAPAKETAQEPES
jgi:3-mercaptopyruvate sulfurtransferase SseA